MKKNLDRRSFIKISALGSAALGLPGVGYADKPIDVNEVLDDIAKPPDRAKGQKSVIDLKDDPMDQVKVGVIGLGNRGQKILELINALCPEKATIQAICDIRSGLVDRAKNIVKKNDQNPDTYSGSEEAWKELAEREDLDLVFVMTNWSQHVPMCVYAMRQGHHVAVEVPAAYTIGDCWKLVDTAEQQQRNCMMMENVCYGAEELWVLNMVKEGVFGTITHGEAAYIHNLHRHLFKSYYYKHWRIRHHLAREGNLYPTHGLGPVAQYMDIQRGDRFEYLVSVSSREASLSEHSKTVNPSSEFHDRNDFDHGDMNSSLIKTNQGRSILLQHDVATPRPYSRINAISGSKGYHEGYPSRLALKGKGHEWLSRKEYQKYRKKYNHPIWKEMRDEIQKHGGHGGMDFVMIYRLIDNFNKGRPQDMDVYDAAAWSAVCPLSEISVELGGAPVQFPDFTRGAWEEKRELKMIKQF